jgi:plasmid maintenance system antidote protein VapI
MDVLGKEVVDAESRFKITKLAEMVQFQHETIDRLVQDSETLTGKLAKAIGQIEKLRDYQAEDRKDFQRRMEAATRAVESTRSDHGTRLKWMEGECNALRRASTLNENAKAQAPRCASQEPRDTAVPPASNLQAEPASPHSPPWGGAYEL